MDKSFIASAGEHFVLYKLHSLDLLAAAAPRGFRDVDIIVLMPDQTVAASVQVKTRRHGSSGGWPMSEKHESLLLPNLFYCFVDLEPSEPVTYVLPCKTVADFLTKAHAAWLASPGKHGQQHNETSMRQLTPTCRYNLAGYKGRWLDKYREKWSLIQEAKRPAV
ncbi:MAG TPA: hypothetical protein VMT17_01080 [Anaeromyxobacteraceae bacterium]|nr:hypothetical protein [Anaeromyxobacteraceae bacterium]